MRFIRTNIICNNCSLHEEYTVKLTFLAPSPTTPTPYHPHPLPPQPPSTPIPLPSPPLPPHPHPLPPPPPTTPTPTPLEFSVHQLSKRNLTLTCLRYRSEKKKVTFEIEILPTVKFSLDMPISLLSLKSWEAVRANIDGVRFFMCDS